MKLDRVDAILGIVGWADDVAAVAASGGQKMIASAATRATAKAEPPFLGARLCTKTYKFRNLSNRIHSLKVLRQMMGALFLLPTKGSPSG